MKHTESSIPLMFLAAFLAIGTLSSPSRAAEPVLRPSDVAFMYEGKKETYEAYGATVLAWGGTPNPKSREIARGVRFFGSVGMVTEFAAYHRRNKDRYQEGLCRDIDGNPVKVPWLVDHQSEGVPYWWCCTRQPLFQQYLRERVIETVRAGADGLHIDDHLGTSGGLWLGLCFCDRCVAGFGPFLANRPARTNAPVWFGGSDPATWNFREAARRWVAAEPGRKVTQHPLWNEWTVYQCRGAGAFMRELRELAAATAGKPLPVGANAGLLWPRHLTDYQAVDLFTAETDHHASAKRFSDLPLFAYRLAEAMERPYAATASGGDWAYIKEHNLPGLVRGWIALSYAGGQRLMAPHHQWCHTPEKGTHWYDGPTERFAPLYQFVRQHAELFDGFVTQADVALLVPHASFARQPQPWFDRAHRLADAQLSYRVLLAGDDLVDHPLTQTALAATPFVWAPERTGLQSADARLLEQPPQGVKVLDSFEGVGERVRPTARALETDRVRVLPRVKPNQAVIHVLNWAYAPERDDVIAQPTVRVSCDLSALGVVAARNARWIAPGNVPKDLKIHDGVIELPELGLWGLLVIDGK